MTIPAKHQDTTSREHLLNISESLFISDGMDAVSLRAIARAAGQKNPSALHYHFGSREELIEAIVARRLRQQEARRAELLREVVLKSDDVGLREVCAVLLGGAYFLCREDASFRDALGVFGLRYFTSTSDYFSLELSQSSPSLMELWRLGFKALSHLPHQILALRMENAYGAGLLAMSRRARNKGSFRGRHAELFFNNLVDQVAAMLNCPVSDATEAIL
ncbi:MAG: helix-turn-helix domain-containing protein [Pseudomonadota bacterium]